MPDSPGSEANAKFVPAYRPEDCDRLLMEAMEKGDIETTIALYETDAVLLTESGAPMKGRDGQKTNRWNLALCD